ncbi:hypothetical protein LPJ56_000925 [Coemansia sp. RSA 2599]|nr:hypothetical protein LPJ75_000515 [Coemansia sp. RSA 2598]KAJ1828720.1 hypothetical protein LPJ56_000925 [Coemansia sp. RSA 2599]
MSLCARRKHVLPECHAVPRTKFSLDEDRLQQQQQAAKSKVRENPVYQNVKHHAHTKSLKLLRRHSQVFMGPELPHDKQLLYRIFYRNKNQHRGSLYFRRIYELRRALRILDTVKLPEMLNQLLLSFGAENDQPWTALPCRVHVVQVARRLAEINDLVEKLAEISAVAFAFMQTQVRQTLFMPFSLVIQGLVARMFLVFKVWHRDIRAIYALLVDWIPALPACVDSIGVKAQQQQQSELLVPVDDLTFDPLKKLVGEKRVAVVEEIQKTVAAAHPESMVANDGGGSGAGGSGEDLGDAVSMDVVSSESSGKSPQGQIKKNKKKKDKKDAKAKRARDMFLDLFE